MNQQTLAYLVSDSGTLIQLKPTTLLQNFKSYNILLFYAFDSKTLYNWIGHRASIAVLEHVENAERLLLGMHPGVTILRRISVKEQDKDSLQDFLQDIGISHENYKERLRLWREFEISIYADIQKLYIAESNHLMLKKYQKSIEITSQIIELASKIHDTKLVEEKEQLIVETKKRLEEYEKQNAILTQIHDLIPKLQKSIQEKNVEDAVSLYTQISVLYKSINTEPLESHQKIMNDYLEFYAAWEEELSS